MAERDPTSLDRSRPLVALAIRIVRTRDEIASREHVEDDLRLGRLATQLPFAESRQFVGFFFGRSAGSDRRS